MKLNLYFCKWDTYFSNAIRMITGDEWSHVGIGYEIEQSKHEIWEALNEGFIHSTYGFNPEFMEIHTIDLPNLSKKQFRDNIVKYEGKGYDWISIINILCMLTIKKPLINIKGQRRLICSEAVALVLKDLGIVSLGEVFKKDEDYITPQEVYNYFEKKES